MPKSRSALAPETPDKRGPAAFSTDGVTVRDYFAATAPTPPMWYFVAGEDYVCALARWNFLFADEMMKARAE